MQISKYINFDKYFGDKKFYKNILILAIPIIIQQLITGFVNMLDNIMVGQTGTLAMSGVSVANQLIAIFNLAIFGLISAASIFAAQFAGKEDYNKVRSCIYYNIVTGSFVSILAIFIFFKFGDNLLSLFMNKEANSTENIVKTTAYALSYIKIMTIGFIPFAFSQAISSSMRVDGETRLPMFVAIVTVFVNFVFNWILIFGKFGFKALGPKGAAIATIISRFVELSLFIYLAKNNKHRFRFYEHFFKDFHIDKELFKDITKGGIPLIINEILYSVGNAAITQSYSIRGIEALASYNISSTIIGLFVVFHLSMGDCISIVVGRLLGANKIEEAVDTDRKLIVFDCIVAFVLGLILFSLAPIFPNFYNTSLNVKLTATNMLRVGGGLLWIGSLYNASYFTLRSGGKTIITLLFDSVGTIFVSFPVSYFLAHYTNLSIVNMYMIICLVDLYKVILGLSLVKKRIWVKNLSNKDRNITKEIYSK
ncbi:MAG: MATE family efflux transporter [Peptoniphilaceae bacterium]|nr:MATE family efflux transporter [Peptoniphilaceae bacterium]MDY6018162.1 MATE family efflux transporter [Anaerococcus sp.]